MKARRFTKRDLIDQDLVAELPVLGTLFDCLIRHEVTVGSSKQPYLGTLPEIKELFWNPRNGVIYPIHPGERATQIHPKNAFHDGFHYLIATAFDGKVRSFPSFILASESIASFTDVYVVLELFARGYKEHFWVADYLNVGNHRDFLKCFNRALSNPFEAFRGASIEAHEFLMFLYENLSEEHEEDQFERLLKAQVGRLKYFPLYAQFDFANYLFFAKARCGKSSRADIATTKRSLSVLKSATSFEDYLSKLVSLADAVHLRDSMRR